MHNVKRGWGLKLKMDMKYSIHIFISLLSYNVICTPHIL